MKNICNWNNCKEVGEYKAPVEKDNSRKYRMLCLEHVKEFNKNWNYFSGMNDDQVINFLKSDMTWHKPTLSFSSSDNFFKVLWNNALKDEIENDKFKSDFNHMRQFKFDHKDSKTDSNTIGVEYGKHVYDWLDVKISTNHTDRKDTSRLELGPKLKHKLNQDWSSSLYLATGQKFVKDDDFGYWVMTPGIKYKINQL